MKYTRTRKALQAIFITFLFVLSIFHSVYAITDHGGANWAPACGSEIAGTHTNVGTFTIGSGCTVYVTARSGSSYGYVDITAISVDIDGTLEGNGRGELGGAGATDTSPAQDGSGLGGGGRGGSGDRPGGGGGAGYGGSGGNGGAGSGAARGPGGSAYGTSSSNAVEIGSGGGGGGRYNMNGKTGGNGGAAVIIDASTCYIQGTITVNGAGGSSTSDCRTASGGGGSGGEILIDCNTVDISSATLSAKGGSGGAVNDATFCGGGGGGAGGRVKIFYDSLSNTGITISVNGGSGGYSNYDPSRSGSAGSSGTSYSELVDVTPPPAPTISSSTHTENTWVSNNDPAFSWTEPTDASGIAGYSFSYDAVPDDIQDTSDTSVTYYDLSEGTHTFYVKAKDNANHWGPYDSYVFKIDTVPPTTTDDAPTETQTQYFTVTLTPYDENSGISATRYRVDGGYWENIEPILIGTDGTHTIEYYSVDNIGNVEPTTTVIVTLERALEGGDTFTYDANGNMVQGPGGLYYEYNDANQLKRVRDGSAMGPIIAEYWYDHTGKRIKKNERGVVTYYWSDTFEQKVYPNGTTVNTTYYFANGERLAKNVTTDSGSTMYYFHPDHLGSTSVVSDGGGNLVEETEYYPYGSTKEGGGEQYLFTSKELDKSTGLYYYGARYYNPELTRFAQADSMIPDPYNPQALNRYAYTFNNPLTYNDPTGNEPNKAQAGTLGDLLGKGFGSLQAARTHYDAPVNHNNPAEMRYVYTSSHGWIDLYHFFEAAGFSQKFGEKGTLIGGLAIVEIPQSVAKLIVDIVGPRQGADKLQWGWHSAFSYEDVPSNIAGAKFGTFLEENANSGKSFEELLTDYLEGVGAQDIDTSADWYTQIPDVDDPYAEPLARSASSKNYFEDDKND